MGKNERTQGYQQFASAQFYENITREQYNGSFRPRIQAFNQARDALNPHVDATTLKNRLWTIDHYRFRYGADHTYWVHALLRNSSKHLMRYKFNYAAKAFILYQGWAAYQNYCYVDSMSFMTNVEKASHQGPILMWGGLFVGACALF